MLNFIKNLCRPKVEQPTVTEEPEQEAVPIGKIEEFQTTDSRVFDDVEKALHHQENLNKIMRR